MQVEEEVALILRMVVQVVRVAVVQEHTAQVVAMVLLIQVVAVEVETVEVVKTWDQAMADPV
jgi:hypothetical protein